MLFRERWRSDTIKMVIYMKQKTLKKIVLSGLFAAIISVATLLSVPLPTGGFANFGDCFVILSGIILGPVYSFFAAGIGSALSDLFLGWANYAPVTFLIKGIMALVAYHIAGRKENFGIIRCSVASITSEAIMICGYFCFELMLYGAGAIANLVGNGLQGIVGVVSAVSFSAVLNKTGLLNKIRKNCK